MTEKRTSRGVSNARVASLLWYIMHSAQWCKNSAKR